MLLRAISVVAVAGMIATDTIACSTPVTTAKIPATKIAGIDIGQTTISWCANPGEVITACSFTRNSKTLTNVSFTYFFRNSAASDGAVIGSISGGFNVSGQDPQSCNMDRQVIFDLSAAKGITLRVDATSVEAQDQNIYP